MISCSDVFLLGAIESLPRPLLSFKNTIDTNKDQFSLIPCLPHVNPEQFLHSRALWVHAGYVSGSAMGPILLGLCLAHDRFRKSFRLNTWARRK